MTAAEVAAPRPLAGKRRRLSEGIVRVLLALCALVSIATTVGIVVALTFPALEFFAEISPLDFFAGTTWAPLFEPARFGVVPLVAGTIVVTFWA